MCAERTNSTFEFSGHVSLQQVFQKIDMHFAVIAVPWPRPPGFRANIDISIAVDVADEASVYGYTTENRHMARAFLKGEKPMLTFEDGFEVVQILMAAYMSAETGQTLTFPPKGLDAFVPAVARGAWRP